MGFKGWGIFRRILVTEEVGRTFQNYLPEHLIKIEVRVEGTEHVKISPLYFKEGKVRATGKQ